jgi:hypothetical protein
VTPANVVDVAVADGDVAAGAVVATGAVVAVGATVAGEVAAVVVAAHPAATRAANPSTHDARR